METGANYKKNAWVPSRSMPYGNYPYRFLHKKRLPIQAASFGLLLSRLLYLDYKNLLSPTFHPAFFIFGAGLVLAGFYFAVAKVVGKGYAGNARFVFLYQVKLSV